jgi:hypothetical protein
MTNQQKALRTVAKYLWLISQGHTGITPEQAKQMSDMCWLALPMKYRMTKSEMAEGRELIRYQSLGNELSGKPQ